MSEEILITVPRTLLEEVGIFQGIIPFAPRHLPLLEEKNFVKIPRTLAEDDPTYKQLVVYFTVRDRMQFLAYWRGKTGDHRLHQKFTMGFGGHINDQDHSFLGALAREFQEELGKQPVRRIELIGLINDDSTKIGEVHLGLYYEVLLYDWSQSQDGDLGDRVQRTSWETLEENLEHMEGWSKYVFQFNSKRVIRPLNPGATVQVIKHD